MTSGPGVNAVGGGAVSSVEARLVNATPTGRRAGRATTIGAGVVRTGSSAREPRVRIGTFGIDGPTIGCGVTAAGAAPADLIAREKLTPGFVAGVMLDHVFAPVAEPEANCW